MSAKNSSKESATYYKIDGGKKDFNHSSVRKEAKSKGIKSLKNLIPLKETYSI